MTYYGLGVLIVFALTVFVYWSRRKDPKDVWTVLIFDADMGHFFPHTSYASEEAAWEVGSKLELPVSIRYPNGSKIWISSAITEHIDVRKIHEANQAQGSGREALLAELDQHLELCPDCRRRWGPIAHVLRLSP